jgi:hypothetical protein
MAGSAFGMTTGLDWRSELFVFLCQIIRGANDPAVPYQSPSLARLEAVPFPVFFDYRRGREFRLRLSQAGVRWFVLRASPMRDRGDEEIKGPTLSQRTREGWGTPFGYGFAWG